MKTEDNDRPTRTSLVNCGHDASYSNVLLWYSYVLVCTRMYSYVLVCTRVYSYVLLWYSYVLVCTRMYSYVTRMYSCGVLVTIE